MVVITQKYFQPLQTFGHSFVPLLSTVPSGAVPYAPGVLVASLVVKIVKSGTIIP